MRFKKLINFYKYIGISLLNTLLFLVLVNFLLFIIFSIRDHFRKDPVQGKYEEIDFTEYYPDMNKSEMDLLFMETWSRGLIYEGFTQFTEAEYDGSYVNIHEKGFRESLNQGTLHTGKQKGNIFIIGGSTTFGYGVKDADTIASHLQKELRSNSNAEINVFNFGRSFYYSSQERILMQSLLQKGYLPSVVVFFDGLNEFIHIKDEPIYSFEIKKQFQRPVPHSESNYLSLLDETSTGRALRFIKKKIGKVTHEKPSTDNLINPENIYLRYITNKRMITSILDTYGIKSLFVWQPIPSYRYDQSFHPFAQDGYGIHNHSAKGYADFNRYLQNNHLGDNFLWLADIQSNEKKPLYIDLVHYSPYMNAKIASLISKHPVFSDLFD